jgi:hypothetical protein
MQQCIYALLLSVLLHVGVAMGQPLPRTFGARALSLDDGTTSLKTLRLDIISPLTTSYQIHFPPSPPTGPTSYLAVDEAGNASWEALTINASASALSTGSMWCGDLSGQAWPMLPGPVGSILMISDEEYGVPMPEWTTSIPSQITIGASQITSGTIQPGVAITVGNGASITPTDGGTIAANELRGAGSGKYSDVIAIPISASSMDIAYSGITAGSIVVVSIRDPNSAEFTVIVSVTSITPGVGFTVTFTAPYPNPEGSLNYAVINP